jgi:membrane-associated phospholipid phosphatase
VLFWRQNGAYVLLGAFSLGILLYVGRYDQAWTLWLREHRDPTFGEWMGRTMFEGSLPGASDPSIVFILACFFLYFRSYSANASPRLMEWRPFLGFFTTATLAGGLGFVHCLKWIIGRARPKLVWSEKMPYTEWYEFGPHYIAEGIYRGSFPSGHTAAVLIPLLLSLIWLTDYKYRKPVLAVVWGALFLLNGVAMGVARAMTGHHWISDCLGVFGPLFLIVWWLYYDLLKVPQQRAYYRRNGHNPDLPKYWEMKFSGYGFFVVLGLILWFWGLRSVQMQETPYLLVLAPIGAIMITWAYRKMTQMYSGLFDWMHG